MRTLAAAFSADLEHESKTTRRYLERIPDDRLAWKPHEKSMTLGYLASHLAQLPNWVPNTVDRDSLDIAPPGGERYTIPTLAGSAEMVAALDRYLAEALAALDGKSDERLLGKWTFLYAGKEVFSLPRIAVLRSMVLHHTIHHRGQLSVYLRLLGVPVPSTYGPSADEPGF